MKHTTPRVGDASATSVAPASTDFSRRRFLFALGASGAGAAAAAASPALAAADAAVPAPAATAESGGYRETEHVRDYYNSTRL